MWQWLLLGKTPTSAFTKQATNAKPVPCQQAYPHWFAHLKAFRQAHATEFMRWPAWLALNAVIEGFPRDTLCQMVCSSSHCIHFTMFSPELQWYFIGNVGPKGVTIDGVNSTSFRVSFQAPDLTDLKFLWRVDALRRHVCFLNLCRLCSANLVHCCRQRGTDSNSAHACPCQ